jgi:hypothetical protein
MTDTPAYDGPPFEEDETERPDTVEPAEEPEEEPSHEGADDADQEVDR